MTLVPLTLSCMLAVQSHYGFPQETMFALLAQEGGVPGIESPNTNGTKDLGPYQINTIHVGRFAREWQVDRDTAYARLRDDGCANAWAAGKLLNEHWQRTKHMWTAIGNYHSQTKSLSQKYQQNVYNKVERLYTPQTSKRKRNDK